MWNTVTKFSTSASPWRTEDSPTCVTGAWLLNPTDAGTREPYAPVQPASAHAKREGEGFWEAVYVKGALAYVAIVQSTSTSMCLG